MDCKGTSLAISQSYDGNYVGVGSEDGYFIIYNGHSGMPVGGGAPATKHSSSVSTCDIFFTLYVTNS